MGIVQKDAFRTMVISYMGIFLGYLNKGLLFLLVLSTEQIGLVNLIVAVGLLFAQFANMGTVYTTWKFLPYFRNEEKRHHGILPLMLLLVGSGIVFCLLATLLLQPQIVALYQDRSALFVEYYLWIVPIGISYVLFLLFEVYLRSFYKNIVAIFLYEIVLRLFITLLLLLLWRKLLSFQVFVVFHSLAYLLPTISLIVYLFYLGHFRFQWPRIAIPKRFKTILFRYSMFNYVNTLGAVLVNALDIMMIAQFLGLGPTGVYSTVIFLTSAIQVPYKSLLRISSPIIADQWKQRKLMDMDALYKKVSSISLVIGLGLFLLIWTNIDFLFGFLGPEFHSGIWVFLFLMIGRLIDMFCGINGPIFSTSKKYGYDLFFTLSLIAMVYVLNLYLIPKWGIAGAAISTSIALITYNLGRILFIFYSFRIHPFVPNQAIVVLLASFSYCLTWWVSFPFFNDWANVVLRTGLVFATFFAPILLFNLEPDIVAYMKNGYTFLFRKKK